MIETGDKCILFDAHELLPDAWRHFAAAGPVRSFNPGLLRDGNGWILAYRVVGADGARRIAMCRLDASLRVIAGSQLPFSDRVTFHRPERYPAIATKWFADPRLYRLDGRVFIYWNSGWHEPANCQFVQELDPASLAPIGHARELVLRGQRQKLEKNWTFFDAGRAPTFFAVYSITPHRVLQFSLAGDDDILFGDVATVEWALADYPACHGGLRGGTPPVLHEGEFWSFCHSVHDGPDGYRYLAAAYRFASVAPFAPTSAPATPISLPNLAERAYERLNPAVNEITYPCGAAILPNEWLVSYGMNDERAAIARIATMTIAKTQTRISRVGHDSLPLRFDD